MPPADKIAAYFAIKSLNLFQNKRELRWGLGDWKEAGEKKKKKIRSMREEGGDKKEERGRRRVA